MTKKRISKTNWLIIVTATVVTIYITEARAVDLDIGASAEFVPALSLTQTDIEFGSIQYTDGAGANDVTLGAADGALSCSNSTEYDCPASATPGSVGIVGGNGFAVNVFCSGSGTLSNGTESLAMNNIEIARDGSAVSCAGNGQTAFSYTITGDAAQDTFNIGGNIEIPDTGVGEGGIFTTAASGGAAINVRVVYQ